MRPSRRTRPGHATVAYFLGKGRRLEVLSIIKRRGSLGLLAHSDEEERLTRTRSEIESGIAIALGGLAAEELCLGESGTGPGADLAHATGLAAQMVGSFGMAGSLISYEAVADGPLSKSNLVGKVLANTETKQKVEDILTAQRERVAAVLEPRTATCTRPSSRRCSSATSSSATTSSRSSRRRSRTASDARFRRRRP